MIAAAAPRGFPYPHHRTVADLDAICGACRQRRAEPCAYSGCPKRAHGQ